MRFDNVIAILLSVVLFFAFNYNSVSSFKCYQCRSDSNASCAKIKNKDFLKECTVPEKSEDTDNNVDGPVEVTNKPESNSTATINDIEKSTVGYLQIENSSENGKTKFYCRKISQILYLQNSNTLIIRECARQFMGEKCTKVTNKLFYINVCDCHKEGCNRSEQFGSAWIVLLPSLIITAYRVILQTT